MWLGLAAGVLLGINVFLLLSLPSSLDPCQPGRWGPHEKWAHPVGSRPPHPGSGPCLPGTNTSRSPEKDNVLRGRSQAPVCAPVPREGELGGRREKDGCRPCRHKTWLSSPPPSSAAPPPRKPANAAGWPRGWGPEKPGRTWNLGGSWFCE